MDNEQHGFAVVNVETMKVYATAEKLDTAAKLAKATALEFPEYKEILIYKLVARLHNETRNQKASDD